MVIFPLSKSPLKGFNGTMNRRRWTREELLLALRLYWQTPFGQQHQHHQPIIDLAERIGRTPSAVAMKLSNFTSLDPSERERGVAGLTSASQMDRTIWNEFQSQPLATVDAMEKAAEEVEDETAVTAPTGPTEAEAIVRVRRHQKFFRRTVLFSYNFRCALTGNPIAELLRASHIVPWAIEPNERVNPRNGLCLNALHDAAFDRGLISFDESFRLMLSPVLRTNLDSPAIVSNFQRLEGQKLNMPEKNEPSVCLMRRHREERFQA